MPESKFSQLSFTDGKLTAVDAMLQLYDMKKSNVSTIGRKDIVLLQKGKQALRMQTSFSLWQGDPDNAITLSIHDLDFENQTVEIKDPSGYIRLVSSERFLEDLQSAIENGSTTLYDYNIATYPYFYFADASGNQRGKPFVEIDTESEDNIFAPVLDADAYFDSQTAADLQVDVQSTTRTVEQFTANGGKLVWTFNENDLTQPVSVDFYAPYHVKLVGRNYTQLSKNQISKLKSPF